MMLHMSTEQCNYWTYSYISAFLIDFVFLEAIAITVQYQIYKRLNSKKRSNSWVQKVGWFFPMVQLEGI